MNQYTILLFYKYVHISDPETVKNWQRELCEKLQLKGRLIIAHEGLNVTLEGKNDDVIEYIKELESDSRFTHIHFKKSEGTGNAFPKLSVKVRPEIVSLHLEQDIDPNQMTGNHLKPAELKQWYESGKEFYVVDMRNGYEFKVGRFKDSVLMPVQNFRDIPQTLSHIEHLKHKTVLSVCTGGVRCEKASGFLVREGFTDVHQLDGGIVSYMEQFPAQEFEGSLYVFDKRIAMNFDPEDMHKVVGKCDLCEAPTERYANCKNKLCNAHVLCCDACRSADGTAYCSVLCQLSVQQPIPQSRIRTVIPYMLQKIGYVVFYTLFKIFVRLEVVGREYLETQTGPFILAANHTHELDPTVFPLVFSFFSKHFPLYFVTNPTEKYKTFGWRGLIYGGRFFKAFGGYPVFSGKKDYAYALQTHVDILRYGHSVCIFPEGKRTPDGALGPARGGLGYLADATHVSVVPVAIDSFYNISLLDFFLRRKKVRISIGKPINHGELFDGLLRNGEVYKEASERVIRHIGQLMYKK